MGEQGSPVCPACDALILCSSSRRERAGVSFSKSERKIILTERGREGVEWCMRIVIGHRVPPISRNTTEILSNPTVGRILRFVGLAVCVVHDLDSTRMKFNTTILTQSRPNLVFRAFAHQNRHDQTARIVPGISGVPEELRNIGVGPMLYSVLLRSPGLSDALVEIAGKIGLSSMLKGK